MVPPDVCWKMEDEEKKAGEPGCLNFADSSIKAEHSRRKEVEIEICRKWNLWQLLLPQDVATANEKPAKKNEQNLAASLTALSF